MQYTCIWTSKHCYSNGQKVCMPLIIRNLYAEYYQYPTFCVRFTSLLLKDHVTIVSKEYILREDSCKS
jgi:hypothetical protein